MQSLISFTTAASRQASSHHILFAGLAFAAANIMTGSSVTAKRIVTMDAYRETIGFSNGNVKPLFHFTGIIKKKVIAL
jgi:uncharacterized membrane protein